MLPLRQRFRSHSAKLLIVGLLAVPALLGALRRDEGTIENRMPAPFPARPANWNAVLQYPAQLDTWINDHFGFRRALVKLNNRLRYRLFGQFPTHQVLEGRNGRIFLAAHATTHTPYSAIHLACGVGFTDTAGIAAQLNAFSAAHAARGIDAKVLIAPSAPAVYPQDLPSWLEQDCRPAAAPIPRVLADPALNAQAKADVMFPLDVMRALPDGAAIPKTWFHWAGAGPRAAAQESARRFWNMDKPTPLVTKVATLNSDIAHLFEGVKLESDIEVNDYAASHIDACDGPACFPELGPIAAKLGDVSRYRNPHAAGGRLVLFTDSYGHYVAGDYAPFFREVVHLSTNTFGLLSDAELAQLRERFLRPDGGTRVLFVYHDVSVLWGRIAADQKKLLGQ